MTMEHSQILYEFKLDHNSTKGIFFMWKVKTQLITVTRWFTKFHLGCKNLNEQAKSVRFKTVDIGVMLQVIQQVAFGEYQASSAEKLYLTLPKYYKTIALV